MNELDKNGFSKNTVTIFKKLCSYVNANYDEIDFQNDDWYDKHIWTNDQEKEFEKWLNSYFKNNPEALKEYFNKEELEKDELKDLIEYFVFNYGWKTENDPVYIQRRKPKTKDKKMKTEEEMKKRN